MDTLFNAPFNDIDSQQVNDEASINICVNTNELNNNYPIDVNVIVDTSNSNSISTETNEPLNPNITIRKKKVGDNNDLKLISS